MVPPRILAWRQRASISSRQARPFIGSSPSRPNGEFARILRSTGWVVLLWNTRRTDTTSFLRGYEALLREFGTDYQEVNHERIGAAELDSFFATGQYQYRELPNEQVFDLAGLTGRLLSSSYVPTADDPALPADARGACTIVRRAARKRSCAFRVRHRALLGKDRLKQIESALHISAASGLRTWWTPSAQ